MPTMVGRQPAGDDTSLADLFLLACRDPGKYWASTDEFARGADDMVRSSPNLGEEAVPKVRRLLRRMIVERTAAMRGRLEQVLRSSKRFKLDRSIVWTVMHAVGRESAETAAAMVRLSRLPFPTMFIEMTAEDVLSVAKKAGAENSVDRMGFLLERLRPDDPTQWAATMCWSVGGRIHVSSVVVLISTDGEPLSDHPVYKPVDMAAAGLDENTHYVPFGARDRDGGWQAPEGYEDAVRVCLNPLADFIPQSVSHESARRIVRNAVEKSVVLENRRFMVALGVLAVINELPHDVTEVTPPGKMSAGTREMRHLDFGIVGLEAGSPAYVDFERSIAEAVGRKAEHDVRAHWRHLRNADGTLRKRVWVSEHKRGKGPPSAAPRRYEVSDARWDVPMVPDSAPVLMDVPMPKRRSAWSRAGKWLRAVFGTSNEPPGEGR